MLGGLAAAMWSHHFFQQLIHPTTTWHALILMVVILAVLYLVLQWAHNYLEKNLTVRIEPVLLSTQATREKEARKGLIVFLPLYSLTPFGKKTWQQRHGYDPSAKDEAKRFLQDLQTWQQNNDYRSLLIDDPACTNFGPATVAIRSHSCKLKVLWIVTSDSARDPGQSSENFVEPYKRYLQEQNVVGNDVVFAKTHTITVDEDSTVSNLVSKTLQEIYTEAERKPHGLKRSEIIVDVTSGTKSMTVGAVLGSIGKERDIQLLAASYEPGVGLKQASVPVIIKYSAVVPRSYE
jgi:hypothetical protein